MNSTNIAIIVVLILLLIAGFYLMGDREAETIYLPSEERQDQVYILADDPYDSSYDDYSYFDLLYPSSYYGRRWPIRKFWGGRFGYVRPRGGGGSPRGGRGGRGRGGRGGGRGGGGRGGGRGRGGGGRGGT